MEYDRAYAAAKLHKWEKYLRAYNLPTWDELPRIDLYMEQVIALLTDYLEFLPQGEKEDKIVTVSAINNYVRMKIMPAPYKKRYSRIHIAYLIMICTLKQTFSIAYIHRMIPSDLTEEEVKARYDGYVRAHKSMGLYFIEQVRTHADGVLHPEDGTADTMVVDKLVFTSAIAANYYTLLAQKLTRLQGVAAIDQLDEIARIEESTKE